MKTRFQKLALAFTLTLVACSLTPRAVVAQATPRTLDAVQEIAADGSVNFTIQMTFDAAAWRMWKAQVGDEPARLRAMMRHQFSAYVIDDFKLEKDDLNRSAKVVMRSAAGPELRKDGSFRIPVEKEFRLVNNTGREWFFSGNNPYAANSLNTIKLVLPDTARNASLVGAGGIDQALHYSIEAPGNPAGGLVIGGIVLLVIGLGLAGAGAFLGGGRGKPAAAAA